MGKTFETGTNVQLDPSPALVHLIDDCSFPLDTSLVYTSFGGFGGTVYIAFSPGYIHVSVFSILLPKLTLFNRP